jgi:hypothetical protein
VVDQAVPAAVRDGRGENALRRVVRPRICVVIARCFHLAPSAQRSIAAADAASVDDHACPGSRRTVALAVELACKAIVARQIAAAPAVDVVFVLVVLSVEAGSVV